MKSFVKLAAAIGVVASGTAHSAGFLVDIHSARATGMATAMKAHVDDASAVLYNPAGLIIGRQLDIQVGDTMIIPSVQLKESNGTTTSTTSNVVPPPHAYVAYGLNDDISVGIGLFSLYGLVVPWPENPPWDGRYISIHSDLKTYFINPEAAFRLGNRVRAGAGIQIIRATAKLSRALQFPGQDGRVDLGGGGWGVGANAGVMVDIVPRMLSFGATYRSGATFDITGTVHFSNVPLEFQNTLHDQNAQTTIHLPHALGFGLAYWPINILRLAVDLDYNGWQSNNNLAIHFPDTPSGALDTFAPKNWTHIWNLHVGGEYTLTDQWRIRAGILYDPTPSPTNTITPELPDADRLNLSAGVGYRWYNFNFDLGYMLVIIMSNTSTAPTFPGTYSGTSNNIGITVGYRM